MCMRIYKLQGSFLILLHVLSQMNYAYIPIIMIPNWKFIPDPLVQAGIWT